MCFGSEVTRGRAATGLPQYRGVGDEGSLPEVGVSASAQRGPHAPQWWVVGCYSADSHRSCFLVFPRSHQSMRLRLIWGNVTTELPALGSRAETRHHHCFRHSLYFKDPKPDPNLAVGSPVWQVGGHTSSR